MRKGIPISAHCRMRCRRAGGSATTCSIVCLSTARTCAPAAARAQGQAEALLEGSAERRTAVLFRLMCRAGRAGVRPACDLKLEGVISKRRRALSLRPRQKLAENQMRHGAGIRHHRLAAVGQGRPAVLVDAAGGARGRWAALLRPRRHRLFGARLEELGEKFKAHARKTPPSPTCRGRSRDTRFRRAGAGR